MSSQNDIGLARKQRVFACIETVFGTLQLPVGTTDFIHSVGNASITQTPSFVDSEELRNTLDVLNRFQNALPAAKWTIPMYLRPSGTIGTAPQGAAFFQSLQGSTNVTTSGTLLAAFSSTTEATMTLTGLTGGTMPEAGVVTLTNADAATEKIRYTGIDRVSRDATTATLTGCTRGYDSSTAITGTATNVVALSSIFYIQETTSPSLSIWIESDHVVQGLCGGSVDELSIDISNEGAVKLTFSGQGMNTYYAGTSLCAGAAATAATGCLVTDASLYSVGAWVYDSTKATGGNQITAVDETNNRIYFDALSTNWASGDTIKGYLPTETSIGDPVLSKDTGLDIDTITSAIKTGSLSIKTPKKYLTDEVGTEYPEDYLEEARDITSTLKLYFRKEDVKYFTSGMQSQETRVHFTFGDTAGSIMDLVLPRAYLDVPTIEYASPAIEMSVPMKALGTNGEDSVDISFC